MILPTFSWIHPVLSAASNVGQKTQNSADLHQHYPWWRPVFVYDPDQLSVAMQQHVAQTNRRFLLEGLLPAWAHHPGLLPTAATCCHRKQSGQVLAKASLLPMAELAYWSNVHWRAPTAALSSSTTASCWSTNTCTRLTEAIFSIVCCRRPSCVAAGRLRILTDLLRVSATWLRPEPATTPLHRSEKSFHFK